MHFRQEQAWVHVGGHCSLTYMAGMLVGGAVFWPYQGEVRMIRIDTATMNVSFVDLPPKVEVVGLTLALWRLGMVNSALSMNLNSSSMLGFVVIARELVLPPICII